MTLRGNSETMADEAEATPATDVQETPAISEEADGTKEEWGEDISPDENGKLYKKMIKVRAVVS